MANKIKDITSQVFGKLTVIGPGELKKSGKFKLQHWMVRCECGTSKSVSGAKLRNGHTTSCGCLMREVAANLLRGKSYTKKYSPIEASAVRILRDVYGNELTFEEFYKLSQQNCHYCNALPSNSFNSAKYNKKSAPQTVKNATFVYNGLDRIDSTKTHTVDNVVPACWICNRAKGNLSYNDYVKHLDDLVKFRTNNVK